MVAAGGRSFWAASASHSARADLDRDSGEAMATESGSSSDSGVSSSNGGSWREAEGGSHQEAVNPPTPKPQSLSQRPLLALLASLARLRSLESVTWSDSCRPLLEEEWQGLTASLPLSCAALALPYHLPPPGGSTADSAAAGDWQHEGDRGGEPLLRLLRLREECPQVGLPSGG